MDYEESGSTDTLNADSLDIPGYLTYVVLLYRLASTVFMIGMGSLVISTIVKTRGLHNVHNILIVNLMVADIVGLVATTFQTIGTILAYITGVPDPFRCDVLHFFQFPIIVTTYTFVMLSLDKFIAIKYALRYNTIITHHRAYLAIAIGWIIALLFRIMRLMYEVSAGMVYDKSSQFGSCLVKQESILVPLFTTIVPMILACSITITLDVYLSIKAYQMYKKIRQENGEIRQVSKDKLNKILQQLKPMVTLLVTILGSMAIVLIISIFHVYVTTLNVENKSYQMFVRHILIYNIGYLGIIVHPVVYGLYFSDIRHSLCRRIMFGKAGIYFGASFHHNRSHDFGLLHNNNTRCLLVH